MCLTALDWLSATVPEFGALPKEEKVEILDFTLLWSFFEGRFLGNNASMPKIREFARNFPDKTIDRLQLNEIANYFRSRYIEAGDYSYRYHHLHLNRSGKPQEVEDMLRGNAQTARDCLVGCLGIIYRYRNNLFHGEKWNYQVQEQLENFRQSNRLLISLMDAAT